MCFCVDKEKEKEKSKVFWRETKTLCYRKLLPIAKKLPTVLAIRASQDCNIKKQKKLYIYDYKTSETYGPRIINVPNELNGLDAPGSGLDRQEQSYKSEEEENVGKSTILPGVDCHKGILAKGGLLDK